jgi:hypothetical protein
MKRAVRARMPVLVHAGASHLGEVIMSEKKPVVARTVPAPGLCPVCGKASYSLNGTHPQCSVARADAISRAARKAAGAEVVEAPRKSWSKPCPKCKRQIPARRIVCDCGHKFGPLPSGSTNQFAKGNPPAKVKSPR